MDELRILSSAPRAAESTLTGCSPGSRCGPPAWRALRAAQRFAIGMLTAAALPVAAPALANLMPQSVADGTYYVDAGNAACSNSGPGDPSQPYCTISAALTARHGPGTTIHVMPGRYREQVTFPASGVSGGLIVLKAEGAPVIVDGTDDFSSAALWTNSSGDEWLASSVTWAPRQVFADEQRLTPSTAAPGSLPPRSFVYVAGSGLYVNAGGGNPGNHGAQVGHRAYGFYASGKSWFRIEGFTVVRADDRCIQLKDNASNAEIVGNAVREAGRMGIQVVEGSAIRIASNVISDNGDHGISLITNTTGCTIEDNESLRNVYAAGRQANGLYLFGSPGNLIQRNRWHDNQDTGEHVGTGSNDNVSIQNVSYRNGDHGFDRVGVSGCVQIGNVAYANYKDGFSFENSSTNCQLYNSIGVDNGITTNEVDLWVDANSSSGFASDDNLFWNSTSQPPVKYGPTFYSSVSAFSAASGHDTRSLQSDPRFAGPGRADFHMLAGSPAIDAANSGVAGYPAADAEGRPRIDDPRTPNTGLGPTPFADRGAFEYEPPPNQPPSAALIVTPSSGTEPLAVKADASGSSDPDGSIASYRFDFGDGTVVGPQPEPSATHTYAEGTWTATVQVTDNAGASATQSTTVTAASANLVGNPSFETDTHGWAIVGGAAIARVPGGTSGSFSLRVASPALGTSPYGITDQPNWVSSTPAAGVRYRIKAWVKAEIGASVVSLRLRESLGSTAAGWVESSRVSLSLAWQTLTLDYVTRWAGSTLDLRIVGQPAVVLQAFRVDDVSIMPSDGTGGSGFEPPVAALALRPASGTEPLAVVADASPSIDADGKIVSYEFDFGDGTAVGPQSIPTAAHTYAAGDWTATVRVTDDSGASNETSATVTVGPRPNQPPVAALAVTPVTGIAPLAVTADASGCSDPDGKVVSYRFDFGDGTVVGPQYETTATHTYEAGTWTASVQVADDAGATSEKSVTVTVVRPNLPPVASLRMMPASGTAPLPVTAVAFGSSDPDGKIASYRFDFGDGTVVGPQYQAVASHTYAAGTWTASVRVTDNAGATAEDSATVIVAPRPIPPPVAALAVTPSSGMEPLAVVADASISSAADGTIASYAFDFGDGTVVGPQPAPTASHTYAAGQWTASVVVTDGGGRSTRSSTTVNVAARPVPTVIASFSFETDTRGWAPVGSASLAALAPGYEGIQSLHVYGQKGSSKDFGVTDKPKCVASVPAAGTTYRIAAWARDESGECICWIRVRETQLPGSTDWVESNEVQLTTSWQLVALDYRAQSAGVALDIQILGKGTKTHGNKHGNGNGNDNGNGNGNPKVVPAFCIDAVSMVELPAVAGPTTALAVRSEPEAAPPVDAARTGAPLAEPRVAPNPLRTAAQLAFATARDGRVSVAIYAVDGRQVRTLLDEVQTPAGSHALTFDGRADSGALLCAGLYFYRIRGPEGPRTGRFVITR